LRLREVRRGAKNWRKQEMVHVAQVMLVRRWAFEYLKWLSTGNSVIKFDTFFLGSVFDHRCRQHVQI
jgi:hypothetical protein